MDLSDLIKRIGIKPTNKRNGALDTYIENSDKKREKLEILLSEFQRVTSDESAPTFGGLWSGEQVKGYYNYLDKNINNFDFDLADVVKLTGNEQLYKIIGSDDNKNVKFGPFLSALINKNIKEGNKVQLITSIPINYLFYKLENAEAYVNIAGKWLGSDAKNSKIYADKVGFAAGLNIERCELHVKRAGNWLGCDAKNSKIYAEEAGNLAGSYMRDCELHVKKAGDYLGCDAKNSKIYAEEAGNLAGDGMKNSKLFIYKLDGKLADSCFEGNNEIYLGEKSYNEFIQNYPKYINKVKLWEKQN
ncbi:hypothetical protein IG206_02105 [Candidatus Parvarchaeota archaeon]|nr:hypothetical protein [Candidatus Acidifodinimicrobium mancum]